MKKLFIYKTIEELPQKDRDALNDILDGSSSTSSNVVLISNGINIVDKGVKIIYKDASAYKDPVMQTLEIYSNNAIVKEYCTVAQLKFIINDVEIRDKIQHNFTEDERNEILTKVDILEQSFRNFAERVNGYVRSFTFQTLDELKLIFGITSITVENEYEIERDSIVYKGVHYNLINGNVFLIVDRDVPDYWYSEDERKLYAMETTKLRQDFSDLENKPTTIWGYGITDAKIENNKVILGNQELDFNAKQNVITSENKLDVNLVDGIKNVAKTGSYNDLDNKPTINNAKVTIKINGVAHEFNLNQNTNTEIDINVPTKVSDLTNDSGFTTNKGIVTGIKLNNADIDIGPDGIANLGSIVQPTKTSQLQNDSDFITSSGNYSNLGAGGVIVTTTAPTSNNTTGKTIIVVLNSEPTTKYEGYLYFIKEE